jgi:hexulose-6-phosphate isomerase
MNRRQFTKSSLVAAAALSSGIPGFDSFPARKLKKGIMWGSIDFGQTVAEKFRAVKDAGFDGVEVMSHMNRNEVLSAMKETGMPVSSVCGGNHWEFPLSDPDPQVRLKGAEALKVCLEDARAYNTDAVLLVPGRVNEKVGYDECWKRSSEEIGKLLPFAEKLGVKIGIENVWNNFILSPMEAVTYIDQFKSNYIGFYFDCGNVLVYGWPEQWIRILGTRLTRVHIKEFSKKIADKQGRSAGFDVKLLEGDVNWKAVMKALDDIGYSSWTTIEQPGGDSMEGLKDLCNRLAKIHES